jgi:hypothetical protein
MKRLYAEHGIKITLPYIWRMRPVPIGKPLLTYPLGIHQLLRNIRPIKHDGNTGHYKVHSLPTARYV